MTVDSSPAQPPNPVSTARPGARRRRGRRVVPLIVTVTACVLVAGCTVVGVPVAAPPPEDLGGRSVSPTDFPNGPGTRVPPVAVSGALADVSGVPGSGIVDPRDCAAPVPDAAGAVAITGPAPGERTVFTTAVVHATESLDDTLGRVTRCPVYTTGSVGTGSSQVTAEVQPAPPAPAGVATGAIRRVTRTGATVPPLVTTTVCLLAERDGVRVYVEYRAASDAAIPPEASTGLDALFGKAVAAAFG